MKRKAVLMLVVAMFAVIVTFAFVACDEELGSELHTGNESENTPPIGDRIFTEDATYDEILTALQNAESVTYELEMGKVHHFEFMRTKNTYRIRDIDRDRPEFDTYMYHANGCYYQATYYSSYKLYDMYIETSDSLILWVEKFFEDYFMADANGKITVDEEAIGGYNYTVKMLGDRMELIWTEAHDDITGNVEYSENKFVYSGINATSFDIPEEVRAMESKAIWVRQITYNGVKYSWMEDEDGSEYYVVDGYYGDDYGPVEETINGLPVRQN